MKAIIIDDEKHVRDGLLLLAEWKRLGIQEVFEASDGEEAKSMIVEHQPEIIFTDMNMPKLDGIQLLKWLKETEITSKTIVVSGYDDFHYMRNAITYGSFDYLLKPIEPDALNETLERAVNEWKKQAQKRESTKETTRVINEAKPFYWDHIFTTLISHTPPSPELIQKVQKEYGVNINEGQCTICLLLLNGRIVKRFEEDKNLAFFTILNICNELVRNDQSGFCFKNGNQKDEIVILLWKHKNEVKLMESIQKEIERFTNTKAVIAIGKPSGKLEEAYHFAQKTLLKHNMVDVHKKNHIMTYEDITSRPLLHLFDYAEKIKWTIQSGSIDQMDEVINDIFHKLESQHFLSFEQIQDWENQFEVLRKNWLKEYQLSEETTYYNGQDYWDEDGTFSFTKFKEEKTKEFHELIELLNHVKYQKEKNSIQEIEAFLRENYDKDFTLQEIADRFFLSREYISRKFKHQYNETITNYMTTIRIDKAKELLENPHLKVYEISFKVGYQNEKYFSKVFKKVVGMTPNEYRVKVADH